jgi:signal peptidase I
VVIPTRLRALSLALLLLPVSGCGLVEVARGGFTVSISSESMEPTLKKGAHLSVRPIGDRVPRTGDIVVFRTPEGWTGTTAGAERVGRVIGIPESTVTCCDADGRLELNGQPLDEPYIARPPASDVTFDVRVPPGRLWIMNDNRHVALDSRAHQGAPGNGTIEVTDVVGVIDTSRR